MAREYTEAELLNDIAEMDCRDERVATTRKQDSRTAEERIRELEETLKILKGQQQQRNAMETEAKEQEGVWEDYNTPRPEVVEIIRKFAARCPGAFSAAKLDQTLKEVARCEGPGEFRSGGRQDREYEDLFRGKAPKQYDSMPREKREAPYEDMLDYFRECVEGGKQARQLMEYADFQRLRLGEGQSVTDFCISLESLNKMAHPDVAEEAKSTLMAHKLYDQFASSADSYHIIAAMEVSTILAVSVARWLP
ncbi:hypothetical protein Aduo_018823 [Ancylostoma duodenale]